MTCNLLLNQMEAIFVSLLIAVMFRDLENTDAARESHTAVTNGRLDGRRWSKLIITLSHTVAPLSVEIWS